MPLQLFVSHKNTTEYVWTQPGPSCKRIRRRILHLPVTDTRAPHVIFFFPLSSSLSIPTRPRRAAAAAARIAEVVSGRRAHAGLGVPVTEEGRRAAEEERSTANSLVGPMTPGRVLVAAIATQSETWRRRRDSVRMEGGALGAD